MKLTPAQREQVRMMFGGRCAYCGIELPEKGWHADHVKAVGYDLEWRRSSYDSDGKYTPSGFVKTGKVLRPENDVLENIFPACAACNIDKGASDLEDWRSWLQERMVSNLRHYVANFRHAERFGRIVIVEEPLIFWFEKYRAEQMVNDVPAAPSAGGKEEG